jgi:glycosyltransferase involved in cell wall biosynthesis
LEQCLRALRESNFSNFCTLVVDSAPNSPAAKAIASRYKAEYAISPRKGVSRARNVGARQARNDIVAYLDDDMIPHPNWLWSVVNEFADADIVAVAGPVLPLVLRDANESELNLVLETMPWGSRRFQIDRSSPQWFERANFGGIGDGNLAIRRSAFNQFPGFDECIGRGATISSGEEHYAYYMLLKIGFKIAYAPSAVVFHPPSPQSHENRRKRIGEAVAYAGFLIYRNPSQMARVIKYCIEGLFGTTRNWRNPASHEIISRSRYNLLMGALDGLNMLLRSIHLGANNCKDKALIGRGKRIRANRIRL